MVSVINIEIKSSEAETFKISKNDARQEYIEKQTKYKF